jgi:GT2 family glycosyltransferase
VRPSDVTVLLPVRNAALTVTTAVRSVVADLGDEPVEIIVVDDASTDATPVRLRELATSEPRIRIVRGEGVGIAAALERGRQQVRTPLIARMDADDLWLAGRLAAHLAAMDADPGLGAVGGEVELFGEPPLGEGMRRYVGWLNAHHSPEELQRERYVESPLAHPAVMLRSEAIAQVGGYRFGAFPEDYDLWLRLLARGWKLANVPQRVLQWRDSPRRLTRTHSHYAPEAHRALKVEHLLREPWSAQPLLIAGAGRTGLPLARALREGGVLIERFVEVHPRKVGTTIEGIPVIHYDALGIANGRHLLVAVGIPAARQEVRVFLSQRGWREGVDFTCVA